MKLAGIIAEFNPFHNGHAYLINKVRSAGYDGVCIVISGDFVQRGIPAVTDKYTRAQMALLCGADLVVELPVCNVLSSAQRFAGGAVKILSNLDIDALFFGTEGDSIKTLDSVASFLLKQDTCKQNKGSFLDSLKKNIEEGNSYAKSVSLSLSDYFDEKTIQTVKTPNNILAVEYLKALKSLKGKNIEYAAIERMGDSYNSTSITDSRFASAAALRESFKNNSGSVKEYIPDECLNVLKNSNGHNFPIFMDDFTEIFNGTLFNLLWQDFDLTSFMSVSGALADKIKNKFTGTQSLSDFAMSLKSKDLSYTRICRSLFQILLGITDYREPEYIRILGLNETGADIIKNAKKISGIPIITKTGGCEKLLKSDIHAAEIYNSVVFGKYKTIIRDEFRHGIVRHIN